MGTRITLAEHYPAEGKASWRLLEEAFENDAVYLEIRNAAVEMTVFEDGQINVVVKLPLDAARRLLESKISWENILGKFSD